MNDSDEIHESQCLKINKPQGQNAIEALVQYELIDKQLEIVRDSESIHIPLKRKLSKKELKILRPKIRDFIIEMHSFAGRKLRIRYQDSLIGTIPSNLLRSLPKAIDFVGDIAVVEIPSELIGFKTIIGNSILQTHRSVRTVLAKASPIEGEFRVRKFEIIAGEPRTITTHTEYGCRFYVDLSEAYFSPRLSFEHHRIAQAVAESEKVVDLFAGVGPFSIQIARLRPSAKVYAIDVNPKAIEFLKKNIRFNRVMTNVVPILGDARKITYEKLTNIADRAIMNLPETSVNFVDVACKAIKSNGGIIHFYGFLNRPEQLKDMMVRLERAVAENGRKVDRFVASRFVREVAPFEYQFVLDISIR